MFQIRKGGAKNHGTYLRTLLDMGLVLFIYVSHSNEPVRRVRKTWLPKPLTERVTKVPKVTAKQDSPGWFDADLQEATASR